MFWVMGLNCISNCSKDADLQHNCLSAKINPRSERSARSVTNGLLPLTLLRNCYRQKSLFYVLSKAWNEFPQHIRTITSPGLFETAHSHHLVNSSCCDHWRGRTPSSNRCFLSVRVCDCTVFEDVLCVCLCSGTCWKHFFFLLSQVPFYSFHA